ncbi:hypothetical protein F0562_017386 [Nyssa sinensis]|uniref:Phorbol-ester/DAG-type domain-containing protein n=1 Tax=Nyssa sinensis TaxID=561372 RepID=A0A5J4ZEN5_9ASTE|nr:hypothetical protein F0562_017386 [Nyssa sinensis]
MELQHFSHEHPLILREENEHDGEEVLQYCNGCLKKVISGPYYCCSVSCDYFLHKFCAELPREMKHPKHPEHPLTLLAKPPYHGGGCGCDVCHESWNSFVYHCSLCNFDVDVICVLLECRLEQCHEHPLIPLLRPVLSLCDACNTEHEGKFYLCITCQFWVHRDCASLPSTIKHSDHHHLLSLAYSLPEDYIKFGYTCDICCEETYGLCWFYYCSECRYVAHVNCATSKTEAFMSILLPDRKIKNLTEDVYPRLPVSDESVSLINHFLKMDLGENKRSREINHFSHDHPLILFDVQNNEESCSESKPSLLNEMKNDNKCNGCMLPISAPFYSCSQCNFFLHKWCAELPTEVWQHPCHPQHTLVLLPKCPRFFGLFRCQCCGINSNGFSFSCASCEFYLDVNCASLPSSITHEAHAHHRLVLKQPNDRLKCNACHQFWSWYYHFGFICDTCDFNLDLECALLPRKTSHRYEEHHPLTLTYSPVKDDSDEYFCEICEEELDPKNWFYHSGECDCNQWFHPECIHPYGRPKIMFGGTIKIANHPHPLTLSERLKDVSKCDYCGKYLFFSFLPSVKCLQCNYKLHYDCIESCNEQSS